MSNLDLAENRLTFDDLLEAVQDSKRGRWFLSEYETRIQKRDTTSILAAIGKLESRMEHLGPQAATTDEMTKVRSAIANARNDLFKLGLGKEAMSKEGRLFAELAEMAKKAIPNAGEKTAGIVRSLQLVDEIDRAVSPGNANDTGAKFFAADSNVFEKPVVAKPVLVEVAQPAPVKPELSKFAAPQVEEIARGAKLIIRKVSGEVAATAVETKIEVAEPVAAPAVVTVETQAEAPTVAMPTSELPMAKTADSPRIVIIRRKAEDMPEVCVGAISAA